MFGLAKQEFFKEKNSTLEIFCALDITFAKRILKKDFSSDKALILAYLMAISRKGHLCLEIQKNQIIPSMKTLYGDKEGISFENLEKSIIKNFFHLPPSVVGSADEKDLEKPIIRFKNRLYLQKNWVYETQIVKNLQRLTENFQQREIDKEKIHSLLQEQVDKKLLLKKQAQAILKCFFQPITFICGGPGTGKTYTAAKLVEIMIETNKKQDFTMAICAPTGKAANHFFEKIVQTLKKSPSNIRSSTLHSLLKINSYQADVFEERDLTEDLILVDEASMIDVKVMAHLLYKTKDRCTLVFLGDPYQLPPVEAGSIFMDFVQYRKNLCSFLFESLRFENQTLISFAEAVQQDNLEKVKKMLRQSEIDFFCQDFDKKAAFEKNFLKQVLPHFSSPASSPLQYLKNFQKFRVLTSTRKGFYGVENLNQLVFYHLQKASYPQVAVPIILCKNDENLKLYNGMTGVLFTEKQGKQTAYFFQQNTLKSFSPYILPKYELGYVLSIHKSQGSEFDQICLVLPKQTELFGKEILYTAITRVKKKLQIIGNLDSITQTIEKQFFKNSGLKTRLALVEDS